MIAIVASACVARVIGVAVTMGAMIAVTVIVVKVLVWAAAVIDAVVLVELL